MRVIRDNVEREVDASECEQLLKDGYKLVETSGDSKKESSEVAAEVSRDIDNMSLAELRAVAKEKGLSGYSSLSKDELLSILKG